MGACTRFTRVAAASAALAATAAAQDEIGGFFGNAPYHHAGSSVAAVGDIDGDGHADWVSGNPGVAGDNPTGAWSGDARLISGRDGRVLFSWFGDSDFDAFGAAVACAGDADGDGVNDVAVGAPNDDNGRGYDAGTVRVFSGSDGRLLRTLEGTSGSGFGAAIAGVGDVDGDGHDDLLVGAPYEDGSGGIGCGVARLFSGADGTPLLSAIAGGGSGERLGASIARAGDLDGDSVPDLLVGAPLAVVNAIACGRVLAISGSDGSLVHEFAGDDAGDGFGSAIASGVDVDGDGRDDVLIGAPGAGAHGRAVVRSGATFGLLLTVSGDGDSDGLGAAIAGVGDCDRDGHDDFVVGAPQGESVYRVSRSGRYGRALLVSGRTGRLLTPLFGDVWSNDPFAPSPAFGSTVAGAGDVDGDSRPDVLVGSPFDDGIGPPFEAGSARLLSGNDLFESIWPPDPVAGEELTLTTSAGRAGTPTLLVIVEADGWPAFLPVLGVAAFDFYGERVWSTTVDAGLDGHGFRLRAYAIGATGRLIASNDEPLELR